MQKFGPEGLIEYFIEQYKLEFGELKLNKIAKVIKDSNKVPIYLDYVVNSSITPTPKGLYELLNAHSFFLMAKEETICVGCLIVILNWQGITYDGYRQEKDILVTKLIADMIIYCQKLKYNKFNNFFDRYFLRLSKYDSV